MEDERSRRSILILALDNGASVLQRITWNGAVATFIPEMVEKLADYGEIAPGKQALWVLNEITDISPISGLTNLTELHLNDNQIKDISSLSELTNLTELYLNNNQIKDISPFSGLTNLTGLFLRDNPIAQPTCPITSPGVCRF